MDTLVESPARPNLLIPPLDKITIRYPNSSEDTPRLQTDPLIIGDRLTSEQFQDLISALHEIARLDFDERKITLDPKSGLLLVHPSLEKVAPLFTPVIAIESKHGTTEFSIDFMSYRSDRPARVWHTDAPRVYIMSNKEGETTQFLFDPKFYFDEDGGPRDMGKLLVYDPQNKEQPNLKFDPTNVWHAPILTFIGLDQTIHRQPEVSKGRTSVVILPFK